MSENTAAPDGRDMRLPGSVAEIEASPPGPKIGAFFDLDGTLVAGFTGVIMTRDRFRRREMGVGEFLGMVAGRAQPSPRAAEFEELITGRIDDARTLDRRNRRDR